MERGRGEDEAFGVCGQLIATLDVLVFIMRRNCLFDLFTVFRFVSNIIPNLGVM